MSFRAKQLGAALVCAAAGLSGYVFWPSADPAPVSAPTPASQDFELGCRFDDGETRAYRVGSHVAVEGEVDSFDGNLSLEVVEAHRSSALVRAAFSELRIEQSLTEPEEQSDAATLEAMPFLMRVDRQCRIQELGFESDWSHAERRLVTTVMRAFEFVTGEGDEWHVVQVDGGGEHLAEYHAESSSDGVRVTRTKADYTPDPTGDLAGISLSVLQSEAVAHFDTQGATRVRGEEQFMLALPQGENQFITHQFAMLRNDDAFRSVAAMNVRGADFRDAFALVDAPTRDRIEPGYIGVSLRDAREAFLGFFAAQGSDAVFPAARFLADWLRANPEQGDALMNEVRNGELDEALHASLFLAFELAGDESSRAVLSAATTDEMLSELNRARAASALADHGEASQAVADTLLALTEDESSMVATVSRLSLGTLAGRAEGELGDTMNTMLQEEFANTSSRSDRVAMIDALGNTHDETFMPMLQSELSSSEPSVRAHAASAMARIAPEAGRDAFVEQLGQEDDPQVQASLLRSLRQAEGPGATLSDEELSVAAAQLASPSVTIRAAAIEWLGVASAQAEVRRVLAAHFHVEQDLRLKQRVGAFVSAAELRNAV